MCASRTNVLSLYKQLIRECKQFPTYNYREYAIRRTRDKFKQNKDLIKAEDINKQMEEAKKSLELVKRQVLIGKMYESTRLVIEKDEG